jgi:hypothetical protein
MANIISSRPSMAMLFRKLVISLPLLVGLENRPEIMDAERDAQKEKSPTGRSNRRVIAKEQARAGENAGPAVRDLNHFKTWSRSRVGIATRPGFIFESFRMN